MKRQLILGLSLLIYTNLNAQEAGHYLYLNGGGGFHNLSYPLLNGSEKGSFGYTLNAGYGYFFSKHWGLQTGIGLQSFKPEATLNYMTGSPATDTDGENYEYRTYYNNWKEKQKLMFLDIPLGLQFRHTLNKKIGLLAMAGVKMAIPVHSTFETTGGEIATTGYYSQYEVELKDMPQHGFVSITDHLTGDVSIKTSYSGFADLGATFTLTPKIDLYTGAYLDYGLNSLGKRVDKLVYQKDGVYNGILASDQVGNAKTVSMGLKLGMLWHFGNKQEVPEIVKVTPISKKATFLKTPLVDEVPRVVRAEQHETTTVVKAVKHANETSYKNAMAIAGTIRIVFNSNQPSGTEDSKINALSEILKANPDVTIQIISQIEDSGPQKGDYELGLQRASLVRQKFLKNGVPSSQLLRLAKAMDSSTTSKPSTANGIIQRVVTIVVE